MLMENEATMKEASGEEETKASSSVNGSSSTLENHTPLPPAKRIKTSESEPEHFEDSPNLENENEQNSGLLVEDYSHNFFTKSYYTKDELTEWVKQVGMELGFTIVTGLYDQGLRGRTPRLSYVCERSGIYRERIKEGDRKRRTKQSKKCDCPFKLKANPEAKDMWSLEVICGTHNHPAADYVEGQAYVGKFQKEEEELVLSLSNRGASPRDIFNRLKTQLPEHRTSMRKIYNIRQKHRVLKKAGRSQMPYLLSKLQENNYLQWHKTEKDGSGVITDLFFAHPTSIDLLRTFPQVLIIDSAYKAIKYTMPMFEIVGITSTNIKFSIAFAFITNEKFGCYMWALNRLKLVMEENNCELPSVIITNTDLTLVNAIENVFPDVIHMFCKCSISKSITVNTKKLIEDRQIFDKFMNYWNVVVQSDTKDQLNGHLEEMREMFKVYPAAIEYVEKSWLIPYGAKFVNFETNKFRHFGNTEINRVESAQSNLKHYIWSSQFNFEEFWDKVHKLLEVQHLDIKSSFENSKTIVIQSFKPEIFSEVRGFVAVAALEIMLEHYERGKRIGVDRLGCDCVIRQTHGLPCAHEIAEFDRDYKSIPLAIIDDHWKKINIIPRKQRTPEVMTEEEFKGKLARLFSALANYDIATRMDMLKRMSEILDSETSQLSEPKEKVSTMGQDCRKDDVDQSSKLELSAFERVLLAENSVSTPSFGNSGTLSTFGSTGQSLIQVSTRTLLYAAHFPAYIQPYITTVDEVRSDGHCGYRALAQGLFMCEEDWAHIRIGLWTEITENIEVYANIYGSEEEAREVAKNINHFKVPASKQHWMTMPSLGCAIATKFNCIVYFLSLTSQYTFLPLRGEPPPISERKEIGIGLVNEDHFVHVKLTPDGPLPPIDPTWMALQDNLAGAWLSPIWHRTNLFHQIKPHK